ncbi:unnamed protein product [Rotaria magnacalcarata]|uniref:Uncharacterized protein n=1 Tax=Rotaria magnacalcarata TaxID=392030 RepID=A0A816PV08_9BILA|nr:unnamed protein product [Rotaria magnacalcarata]CAF1489342.1 unnamed protein product [Rotaria magnacalcarata]CAF2052744.1 unnamed protein product [Rotaria magnacalcarata]CAF2076201.1 unnamed protein product [Rotaria magnacalcarata]CAF2093531.1 unnamed protein product [Rotaria magnacalcarata]
MKSIIFLSLLATIVTVLSLHSVSGAPAKSKRAANNSNVVQKSPASPIRKPQPQQQTAISGKITSNLGNHPPQIKKSVKSLSARNVRMASGGASSKTKTTRRVTSRTTTTPKTKTTTRRRTSVTRKKRLSPWEWE